MSTTTALQLIQQATGEIGLNVPTTAFANTNADVVQIYRLLNSVGYEISREHPWQALNKAYFFTTPFTTTTGTTAASSAVITAIPSTAGLSTSYTVVGSGIPTNAQIVSVDGPTQVTINQNCTSANTAETLTFSQTKFTLPSDWDRQIDETHWDKTKHWKLIGPETAQQWEWLVSGYIATGPRVRYRIMGNTFQIWPPQGAVASLGFEYVSNAWAVASGVAQGSFLADTDTCIFPDRLMVLGLKHRYTEAKGLPLIYQEAYNAQKDIAKANDAGAQTLSMAPTYADVLITWQNIPDANFTL